MEPLRVAIVAGETSGDALGAALMLALRARAPETQFRGVAGPKMRAAGCDGIADAHELAVMGLFEPMRHLPRLLRLRRELLRQLIAWQPHVFIGVDAPGFNLGLAAQFKAHGARTVQYVSPQVWAWRQGRVRMIARRCDLVLCLLPFEPPFYSSHAVHAQFVGHPLADEIPLQVDRDAARRALGLSGPAGLVALLPGSRIGEVERMGARFIDTARELNRWQPTLRFVAPMASAAVRAIFERQLGRAHDLHIQLLDGQSRLALSAADVALVASGTAALEALLCDCPMVVAYRVNPATAAVVRLLRIVRLPYFSLPNLLAGEPLVPEFFQGDVRAEPLAAALREQLENTQRHSNLQSRFRAIHEMLRRDGAARAAEAVLRLLGREVAA